MKEDDKMYCSNCGNEIEQKANFCPICGKKIITDKKNKNDKKDKKDEKKKYKPNKLMVIVIALNIILLIVNIFVNGKSVKRYFETKEYSVVTSSMGNNSDVRINEKIIDEAIEKLKNVGLMTHEIMYVVYKGNLAKQYLVITEYSKEYGEKKGIKNTIGDAYQVKAIDAETGFITDIITEYKAYGRDYLIRKAIDSRGVAEGDVGKFRLRRDYSTPTNDSSDVQSTSYVSIALSLAAVIGIFYFIYRKTKKISVVIVIIGIICILVQLKFILLKKYEKYETNETNKTSYQLSDIHGVFTDREYSIASEGYGISYTVYSFLIPGNVKYEEEGMTYRGTYSIEDNIITIKYIDAVSGEDIIKSDKTTDTLIIKDRNTLVTQNGIEYLKD